MIVKLLTKHHLEFLRLKEAAEASPSLHWSKCQIVRNLMPWLNSNKDTYFYSFMSKERCYLCHSFQRDGPSYLACWQDEICFT